MVDFLENRYFKLVCFAKLVLWSYFEGIFNSQNFASTVWTLSLAGRFGCLSSKFIPASQTQKSVIRLSQSIWVVSISLPASKI